MTKRMIQKNIDTIHYNLSDTIERAIEYLTELKAEADEKGVKLRLDYDSDYRPYSDHDRYAMNLIEVREETDEEYSTRLQKEESDREEGLRRKRKQLEDLKKELGES